MTTYEKTENMQQNESPSTAYYPLQCAIWPQRGLSTEREAHFVVRGPVGLSLSGGGADFGVGGRISTGAYYNVFNLGKWRKNAGELPLELHLKGHGRFALSIRVASPNESWFQIYSETITLDGELRLPVAAERRPHSSALLFFSLTALEEGRLDDFTWMTTQAPQHRPKLTIAVTTFKREEEVAATAERFRQFRAASDLRDDIDMVIVDNGNSVDIQDGGGVTVIPNENLGGAGGFSRGLIAAKERGATHCLFMDDDASIQTEALSRTWWFLAYALDPRTTVAGGMINAAHRWQMWENGSFFDLGCKPRFHALDLRNRNEVYRMEYESTEPAPPGLYGGWWFFAFPISQVTSMPFPFFVRGDDVAFSLANDFNIVTLPGVASIQESFADKASPMNWYLDFRSHLVHHLYGSAFPRSWGEIRGMILNFYKRNVLRFHYDSLSAVNLALWDALQGPHFFDENADMAQRRQYLKEITQTEVWRPIPTPPPENHGRVSPRRRSIYRRTLNGHLIPFGQNRGESMTLYSIHRDNYGMTYGAREVTYVNASGTASYTVKRSTRRFWRESLRLLRNVWRLRRRYSKMQTEWRENYSQMTTDNYWNNKLRLDQSREAADPPQSGVTTSSRLS